MTAPKHLTPSTRRWWTDVAKTHDLSQSQLRLLTLAGEAWDRCEQARETLAEDGLTFTDRYGNPRSHPAVAIERDSRLAVARLLGDLHLEVHALPKEQKGGIAELFA